MPHLNDLQSKHADDGVTIIAVTKEDSSNSLDKVKKMVQDKSDVMGYTVAWDDGSSTYEAYMTATGQRGIPTSFIIDPKGKVAYQGAIDSIRSTDTDDIIKAENYVLTAFKEIESGNSVKTASTEPYGCGVKYQ